MAAPFPENWNVEVFVAQVPGGHKTPRFEVSVKTVQSSLRGTSEGAAVAAATRSGAATSGDGQAITIADGLNPSIAAIATGGRAATPAQSQKDPSSGTGGDNISTKTATVTIVIHHP